ncbi:MAG: DNA topoisomerase IV subunit B [Alphaproteobacteria bacterium]|nr:MAG: DNA topoisomerase IV subunit B [Alphaproteobacteria bacterium]
MTDDLFANAPLPASASQSYTAQDIEVLEGLEPVRRRPGMYIGGTDEHALHHLLSEVFDNAMDEAVAGHANRIEVTLHDDNRVTVRDNGRGIPIDPHPKYPDKSALEVILTTLHSGGKFSGKAYETSGGLHGVGISVVNALSSDLVVEVAREKTLYRQLYARGNPLSPIETVGGAPNRRGTTISFVPDTEIFGAHRFRPAKMYQFVRSKAFLYKGVEIRWNCPSHLVEGTDIPAEAILHYPSGLKDFLEFELQERPIVGNISSGTTDLPEGNGRVEWAIAWPRDEEATMHSYCNTIVTPQGGTHEAGLRTAITKAFKSYGDMSGQKKANNITADDIFGAAHAIISVFIREPQFQGQTKEKLVSSEVTRLVEQAMRDPFDHWLSADVTHASLLLEHLIRRADERLARKKQKDINRKSITQKLRLPGKLTDCSRDSWEGTELYLVEGDSAGGSAKQARDRETQAILPLRGKILNVASATRDKVHANQEISDIIQALGCGSGKHFDLSALRYERIIIMTDADVDGAHIASLLMTFFYQELPEVIRHGRLFIAQPPLYRVTHNKQHYYPANDAEKETLLARLSKERGNIEVGRFKGLGEMTPAQLKETTMTNGKRTLLKVLIADDERSSTATQVHALMGKKPELRFQFIQEQTELRGMALMDTLDI